MLTLRRSTVFTVGLLIAVAGCGGGGPSGPPVIAQGATTATGTVPTEGGTLRLDDGSAIVVAAGALTTPAQLTMSKVSGLPAGAPEGPNKQLPVGSVFTTGPHGKTFVMPIEVRIALPAQTQAKDLLLFTQAGDGTDWVEVANVNVNGTNASVQTMHFSHWAWFPKPGSLLDVPTTGEAYLSTAAVLDMAGGWGYYVVLPAHNRRQIHKAALTAGAQFTVIYTAEPGEQIQVVAAGPEGVFFFREDVGMIARMNQDGSNVQLDWAHVGDKLWGRRGQTTSTQLFIDTLMIPLATGIPVELPFTFTDNCALSPDRTRAGCVGYDIDTATLAQTKVLGASNGDVVTDGTHWYFMSNSLEQTGYVTKAPYGSDEGTVLIPTTTTFEHMTIQGNTLYVSEHIGEHGSLHQDHGIQQGHRSQGYFEGAE